MTKAINNMIMSNDKISYSNTDQIDELMELFDMHNLVPKLSKQEHVYVTSLAMLISSLNWNGDIRHLFESLPYIKGREVDLLDILNTMSHLGYKSDNMELNLQDVDYRLMPCLFVPNNNLAPLVLLKKENGIITAFDSRRKQKVEFKPSNSFWGSVYFFSKINTEEMQEDTQVKSSAGLSWFSILFYRFHPIVKEIIFASFVINTLALAMPLFIMSIYDVVIGSGSTDTLKYLIIGVVIAVTGEAILRVIRLKSIVWLGCRLDNIVSNTIFERLLLMKASYTEGLSISAQISRIKAFESVRKFFVGPLFSVVIELPFTIILLLAIWLIAGSIVYIPIALMLVFVVLLYIYQSRLRVSIHSAARAGAVKQQHGVETLMKMHVLHYNGMADNWWIKYKDKMSKASMASFKSNMLSSTIESAAHAVSMLAGIGIVAYGVHLIWEGEITIGALVATMIIVWRILSPLQTLCSMLPRVEQLKNSINQINKLVNIEVERTPSVLKRPIKHLDGNIKLTNLGLRYSTESEPLFVGLDIDIKPGEVIAITGSNGSGKSSILKLVLKLYRGQTGTIRIDGTNIKQLDPVELRRYIAYMPQMPSFFKGTIKENLLLANPLANDEDLHRIIKKVGGGEDFNLLENGLYTTIYGNNPDLPSGFIYILNLARVMIKDQSNIILLDEMPNASLNGLVGEAYKKLIMDSKGNKTVLFVSQREDTIKLADRVIVLQAGNRPAVIKPKDFINKFGN